MSLDIFVNRQERDGLLIGPYESEHVMVLQMLMILCLVVLERRDSFAEIYLLTQVKLD